MSPHDAIVPALSEVALHGFGALHGSAPAGKGSYGEVYRHGDYAIKRTYEYDASDYHVGLPALRAAIILSEGLERLEAAETGEQGCRYDAPMPYACLVNNIRSEKAKRTQVRSTLLMPFIEGDQPTTFQRGIPLTWSRVRRYKSAVRLCGADPGDFGFDDSRRNLKVAYNEAGTVNRITKLDSYALNSLSPHS